MMSNNLPAGKMYKKPIKKNVGLRAFFPEMPISMSNLEKAKIWVKRHNNNYFMGWTQEQLQNLDPIVRPLTIITPELYKRHMNRSEYCRIVKLKYCLESDADWAKEFRRRLGTDSSKGGFRSLGEAKLYATQLWRQYSELYDVHRARIGNSNSRASLEKHHSLDGSSRDTKAIHISCSGSAISSSATSLLSLSGSPDSLIPPFRREDDKLLGLHLASMDESNNHHLNEFPSSSSLNISPLIKVEREEKFESSSTTINTEANWSVDNNKVSSSHSTPVFPSVDQMELSILERVDVLLRRRRKDFFLGYTEDQLRNLSPYERPLTTVTEKEYQEYLFSDEGQLTSALATVFDLTEPWAFRFKKMLHLSPEEGGFATWPDVKHELYVLLQNHLSGNSNSQESMMPSLLDGSHGTMPSLSLDSDLPSTSGLVDRASENIDFTTSSGMLLGKDSLKESTISMFSSGILTGRLTSQKKSPDSSDRTVVSQASPSAPETTEDAITIDDDTNSEDNFAASNQSQMKSPPISSNGPKIDDIWGTNSSSSNDHRRAANHLQQQFLSDSSVSITSSIERSGHSVTAVSSSLSAMSTPNRFGSPLGKVSNRISLDLASFGRNQGNSDQLECSAMEPRNSRVVPRFSSQSAIAMDTSSGEVPSMKTSNRSNSSRLVAGPHSLYTNSNSSSKSLVSKLWSLRDKLADRCRDDPAVSWHDKLRPHLKLIRSQLGETYTLPISVHESIADLFLVTLQLELLDKPSTGFGEMS